MSANLKRLGALAIAQCGSFVVVLIIGVFAGPGHQAPQHPPTPTATARHSVIATPSTLRAASHAVTTPAPGRTSSSAKRPSAKGTPAASPSTSGRNPRQGSPRPGEPLK